MTYLNHIKRIVERIHECTANHWPTSSITNTQSPYSLIMTDIVTQPSDASNKLSAEQFQDWKEKCINKALQIDAYGILDGSETEPTKNATPTSDDLKLARDFRSCKSKIAGYIRDTLDTGQRTIIANLAPNDGLGIWKALLARFESKDTNSRMFATQQLLSLHKGDGEHESENFSKYGT
ncbi:hypothetical protein K439DRAFT_1625304 [Ramaria rubella]|nr:hypothetical protein K439DRAFT_1625304 [Ramaria rubella]